MATVDPFSSRELDAVLAETRRRGRRRVARRRALAGVAGLLVAVAVAVPAALAAGPGHRNEIRTTGSSRAGASSTTASSATGETKTPSQIVALEANGGRIAVISAANGKIVRVLATTNGFGTPTLAVAPDAVYFGSGHAPARNECPSLARGFVDEVDRVLIRGGPVTMVAQGASPAVSPNGRLLAYTRDPTNPCAGFHDELVVADLVNGTQRTFTFRRSSPRLDLENLSWAPDSMHLAYNQYSAETPTNPKLIDTATAHTLDDATPIPHAANTEWGGFLGPTGALGVTPGTGSFRDPATVVELDSTTGAVTRTLFTVPGGLAVDNGTDGPEDTVRADRSGRDVLAIGLLPVNGPIRHGALYRWHEGDRRPTLVADQIQAATWIEPRG